MSHNISSRGLIVGWLVLAGASVYAQTHDGETSSIKVLRDIAYREGDSEAWRLDLAMPAEQTEELRPALVIVHGGGWRGGSRTVDVFQKMMTEYAKKDYVAINIDYRLTGEAPFPACIEDVKCAVRWLRAHAEEYHVDPNRIGAYGHSAGAHLAMMLAMAPKSAGLEGDGGWEEHSSKVNAVAAGSPPTELGRDVPMAKPEWWPIGYIAANHPPMLLIQGGADRIVRAGLTDDFVEKMKAEGAAIEYLKIEGAGHGVAYAEKLGVTDSAIDAFFARHLQPESGVKAAGTSAEDATSIDALLQSFVNEKKVSSVVGFVAKDGQVVYHKAFGWKDVENRIPAAVDDYYVLFSQTKAIVSVAFMTLVERGLVKVDDPVSEYFPEIPDQVVTDVHEDGTYETRPVASPMTFAHLLSHSSGLNAGLVGQIRRAERQQSDRPPGLGGRMPGRTPSGQHSGGGNYGAKYLKDEMLALAKYPLGFDPGTEWSYHVSTNMLGYMIERISGKPLRKYVQETVLEPLGMNDTDWYYEPEALSRFVKPYRVVDGRLEPASTMYSEGTISEEQTYCEGAIGLNGPIEDYAKFCRMLLNKGEFNGRRLLKPETVEMMTTVNRLPEKNSGGDGFRFGLGFELYNEHKKPVSEVSNSAFAWGGLMGTAYIIDPGHNMIALFYINMYNNEPVYPEFLSKAYQLFEE